MNDALAARTANFSRGSKEKLLALGYPMVMGITSDFTGERRCYGCKNSLTRKKLWDPWGCLLLLKSAIDGAALLSPVVQGAWNEPPELWAGTRWAQVNVEPPAFSPPNCSAENISDSV